MLRNRSSKSAARWLRRALVVVTLITLALPASAAPVGDLEPEERAVVEALAQYDTEVRRHALEAASEADVLGDLVRRQQRSSETFRRLLEPYERSVQEDLYELARYPELVSEIVEGGPKTQAELEAIAFRYPEDVAAAAARSGHSNWKVIARTDALLRDEHAAFEDTIAHLPEHKQTAFRSLIGAPDLLILLAENTGVAVLLGDAYEREPDVTVAWLDEVSRDAADRGSEENRELAEAIGDDEELAAEVADAAEEYEDDTGHSAYPRARTHVTVNVSPYPFWIGHPWWYASSYGHYDPWYWWYPRVAWSFGGSHFGPRFHASVSFGSPHGAFWGWYFGAPSHHQRFARVTHHVVGRFERHRGHRRSFDSHRRSNRVHRRHGRAGRHAVHRFVRDTERSMPRGFLARDGRRIERFREYGKLHDGKRRDRNRDRRDVREPAPRRGSDLLRRVRADGERYPRLGRLSREPERSRIADRRDRRERRRDVDRRDEGADRGSDRGRTDLRRAKRDVAAKTEGRKARRDEARTKRASRRDERREATGTKRDERREATRTKRDERRETTRARSEERRQATRTRSDERRSGAARTRGKARSEPNDRGSRETRRREPRASASRRAERGGDGRTRARATREAPRASDRSERPRREARRSGSSSAHRAERGRSTPRASGESRRGSDRRANRGGDRGRKGSRQRGGRG